MATPPAKPASGNNLQSFGTLPIAGKAAIGVLVVVLLGAIYYFALHSPLSEDIESARTQHASLLTQMQQAQDRQQEFIALREQLAAREGVDRANLRVLPEEAEIASFLQDLNRLSEMSGLAMRLVEPRPEEPEAQYIRLPVSLRVAGRYHQLARFMYSVSRLERAISLEDISMREPHLDGEDVMLTVDLMATTFRRPSTTAPAGPAATPTPGAPAPTTGG
jgi:type IV pilus assembly protein PilO